MLCQRRKVMEDLKEELGPWGRPLSSNAEYPESMIYFQEGNPSSFWLSIDTKAKARMQEEIQALVEGLSLVVIQNLVVGDLVLARYPADGKVYRARIVKVAENSVSVRYIDYGNMEEGLLRFSLYAWDPVLEIIPAQAFLCRFSLPEGVGTNLLDDEEVRAFSDIMRLDYLRVVVKRRLQAGNLLLRGFDADAPELEVSLFSKSGTDMIVKLSRHKLLRKHFQGLTDHNSKQQPIEQRPLLKPPPPLHLAEEGARAKVEEEDATSPLPQSHISRAVDNVMWWFEHKFEEEARSE